MIYGGRGALTIIANFSVRMFLSGVSHQQQQQTCFDINMPGAEGLMVMAIPHPVHSFRGHKETAAVCCLCSGMQVVFICTANEWDHWVGNVPA